jgi:DNA-binding response OmpR family regulator
MAPHTERRLELLVLAEELTQQRIVAAMSVVARRIVGVADAQALRRHLWARLPNVIILAAETRLVDVTALCRHIRQFFQTPILVLEDGASRQERIGWLDSGADDVLALRAHAELCARCFALLRRVQRQQKRDPAGLYLHALGFQLDIAGYRLYNPLGQPIDLNAEHTRLLAALFSYNGGIVPDEVLDRHMWDSVPLHAHSRLTGLVRRVNRRIAAMSSRPLYVERVRNNGYRLSLPTSGGPPL